MITPTTGAGAEKTAPPVIAADEPVESTDVMPGMESEPVEEPEEDTTENE